MDLNEAILNARSLACGDDASAAEHDQLAKWLEELRDLRIKNQPVTREEIMDTLEGAEAKLADGFESAMIGYIERSPGTTVALYEKAKCIHILIERDGMSEDEAEEFFDFNVLGAWVGDATPAFATLSTCQ